MTASALLESGVQTCILGTGHVSGQLLVTTSANGVAEARSHDASRLWLTGQGMGIVTTAPDAGTGGASLFPESCTRNDLAAFWGVIAPFTLNWPIEPALWHLGYDHDTVDRLTQPAQPGQRRSLTELHPRNIRLARRTP